MEREAWKEWQSESGGLIRVLQDDRNAIKGLLPLLYYALRPNQAVVEPEIAPILKHAYVREKLRYEHYRQILGDTLAALEDGGVPTIVLGGAALAETVYPEPALRHSHEIELFVEPHNLARAESLMLTRGFRPISGSTKRDMQDVSLAHSSGLPLKLSTHMFETQYYELPKEMRAQTIWSDAQRHKVGGVRERILAPEVHLWRVLGHASCSASRQSLLWVCDAWYLIGATRGLDWNIFMDLATRSNLALPLARMLSYLAKELNVEIPASVLERLKKVAMRTEPLGFEIALDGAHHTSKGRIKNMIGKSQGWSERIIIAKWVFDRCSTREKEIREV